MKENISFEKQQKEEGEMQRLTSILDLSEARIAEELERDKQSVLSQKKEDSEGKRWEEAFVDQLTEAEIILDGTLESQKELDFAREKLEYLARDFDEIRYDDKGNLRDLSEKEKQNLLKRFKNLLNKKEQKK